VIKRISAKSSFQQMEGSQSRTEQQQSIQTFFEGLK